MKSWDRVFIGGDWVTPSTEATLGVVSPSSEEVIAHVPDAGPADMDRAVEAAAEAFQGDWPWLPMEERAACVSRISAGLWPRLDELAETITAEGNVDPSAGATPMKDRVAVIGLLNKRNGQSRDVTLKPGQTVRIGDVILHLRACERTAPWEPDELTGAFVQVDVQQLDLQQLAFHHAMLLATALDNRVHVATPAKRIYPEALAARGLSHRPDAMRPPARMQGAQFYGKAPRPASHLARGKSAPENPSSGVRSIAPEGRCC